MANPDLDPNRSVTMQMHPRTLQALRDCHKTRQCRSFHINFDNSCHFPEIVNVACHRIDIRD